MNLSVLMKLHKNKYQALQAAKWLQKNLKNSPKRLSQDIAAFEDYMNEDLLLNQNKCPHCRIEM